MGSLAGKLRCRLTAPPAVHLGESIRFSREPWHSDRSGDSTEAVDWAGCKLWCCLPGVLVALLGDGGAGAASGGRFDRLEEALASRLGRLGMHCDDDDAPRPAGATGGVGGRLCCCP